MKYIAILRQEGGCDYTIGCGINTIQFEAVNAQEAAAKLQEIVIENYSGEEQRLKTIHFFEAANSYEVDLNKWYKKIDDAKKQAKLDEVTIRELAELDRLKKKYNQ
jgi:hypothetical protein